MVIYFVQPELT